MAATIQSLERGLAILAILGKSQKALSLNELAAHFTIDRSSVFRLVHTLVRNGFVRQDGETKRYSLGYRMLELSGICGEQFHIEGVLRPIMRRICESTRQNTHLAVLDGHEVVFIAVEQPRDAVTLNLSVGTREPAFCTALGRALLASLGHDRMEILLEGLRLHRYTEKSVVSRAALRKILEDVRRNGLARDEEEFKRGIFCFASPVFNHRREAFCSIGISGPRNIIKPQAARLGKAVKEAAAEASLLLGCPGEFFASQKPL